MLRLVEVTKNELQTLYRVASMVPDNAIKVDVLTQTRWLLEHFPANKDIVKMVLVANMHEAILAVASYPLMPADADRLGITFTEMLKILEVQNSLVLKLRDFDMVYPDFMDFDGKPDTTFLN